MIFFFLGVFFFQSDRPTDPISGNAFDAKRKKRWGGGGGGVGDGVISDKDTAERYVQVPVPRKPNILSFH